MKIVATIALLLICISTPLRADTLTTKHYIVTITQNCLEGEVSCDQVHYTGISKKSGNRIDLNGSTMHSLCADGETPCRFLGYIFHNGNIRYQVSADGVFTVIQNNSTVLLEEQGTWSE